jgi:hypothetical protein
MHPETTSDRILSSAGLIKRLRLFFCCVFASCFLFSGRAHAALSCAASAVPIAIHIEGVSELLGDIVINCRNGSPGPLRGNIELFNVRLTNRITHDNVTDVVLTVDTGAGPVISGVGGTIRAPEDQVPTPSLAFNDVNFTVPASGKVDFRISNLRGYGLHRSVIGSSPVGAVVSLEGAGIVSLSDGYVPLGISRATLLASTLVAGILPARGSPLPESPTFSNLLGAGTRFASARFTEYWEDAFQARRAADDNGLRILSRYSDLPSGTRLLVPDAIAGSNSVRPTAGGDFGVPASAGQYAPNGKGSLLLVRVRNADANGGGGSLVLTPQAGINMFDSVSELDVVNGTAQAVYEVGSSLPSSGLTLQPIHRRLP